jgi:hypothetical protein
LGRRRQTTNAKGATGAEPAKQRPAVRERIAQDADNLYPAIKSFFEEALNAKRKVWTTCTHCDRRTEVEVPDWNARAKILETLLNQGFGRPPSSDLDGGVGLIVNRIIVAPDGAEMVTDDDTVHVTPAT